MRRQLNKYFFLFLLCLFATSGSYAQAIADSSEAPAVEVHRNITAAEWNEISNDPEFHYRDSLEYKHDKKVEKKPLPNPFLRFFEWLASGTGQFVAWGLLILIVLYAVYRIIAGERSGIFGRKNKTMGTAENELVVEDINETNWEKQLQKAATEGDLRLALRDGYMLLLQMLQHNELIHYRNDKTNYEYYSELTDTPYKNPFRQISRQYEYTWYGNFPISQEAYDEYIQLLYSLKKQLGR